MGLVDALLAREHHTLRTTESIEACRHLIGNGVNRYAPVPRPASPFFVRWSGLDSVQLWTARPPARGIRRVMRVHLVPDGFGTGAEATMQISGLSLGGVKAGTKPDGLLEDLACVLHAASIDGVATPEYSSLRRQDHR